MSPPPEPKSWRRPWMPHIVIFINYILSVCPTRYLSMAHSYIYSAQYIQYNLYIYIYIIIYIYIYGICGVKKRACACLPGHYRRVVQVAHVLHVRLVGYGGLGCEQHHRAREARAYCIVADAPSLEPRARGRERRLPRARAPRSRGWRRRVLLAATQAMLGKRVTNTHSEGWSDLRVKTVF